MFLYSYLLFLVESYTGNPNIVYFSPLSVFNYLALLSLPRENPIVYDEEKASTFSLEVNSLLYLA